MKKSVLISGLLSVAIAGVVSAAVSLPLPIPRPVAVPPVQPLPDLSVPAPLVPVNALEQEVRVAELVGTQA